MALDMDYKDKYLRTFAENQKLKKQRNDHLEQIKRKNTEIRQLKEDFKVRLTRQSGVPRTSSGGKNQTLSGEIDFGCSMLAFARLHLDDCLRCKQWWRTFGLV